jgi:hypothetical protein
VTLLTAPRHIEHSVPLDVRIAHDDHALDHVLELPDIAREATAQQRLHHVGGDAESLAPEQLGFKDGYFRGYREGGADGYEVIEVILDPDEVVSAPEGGRVRRQHFEQVLAEKRR